MCAIRYPLARIDGDVSAAYMRSRYTVRTP